MFKKTLLVLALCAITFASAFSQPLEPLKGNYGNREILIFGSIDESTALRVQAKIRELDKANSEEITIRIFSPGGGVYAGLGIVAAMHTSASPIKTVCEVYCMSMAAVILAAGDPGRRYVMPYATVMLHQVSGGTMGNLSEMQNTMKEITRLQDLMNLMVMRATGLSRASVELIMSKDSYMSPSEAIALGLADYSVPIPMEKQVKGR